MQLLAVSQKCSPSRHHSLCELPVLLVLQQQNFKQKVVALLRRFKVSEEVSGPRLCVAAEACDVRLGRECSSSLQAGSASELSICLALGGGCERGQQLNSQVGVPCGKTQWRAEPWFIQQSIWGSSFRFVEKISRRNKAFHAPAPAIQS